MKSFESRRPVTVTHHSGTIFIGPRVCEVIIRGCAKSEATERSGTGSAMMGAAHLGERKSAKQRESQELFILVCKVGKNWARCSTPEIKGRMQVKSSKKKKNLKTVRKK